MPQDKTIVKCMYCGGNIFVQEAISKAGESNVANWLCLAREALNASNYEEAFNYFTKMLEFDPQNSEAWFGKAQSAGWMSTLTNFRVDEMIGGFKKVLECTPVDKKDELKKLVLLNIYELVFAYYKQSTEHFLKIKTSLLGSSIPSFEPRREYAKRSIKIISAMELAHELLPERKEIIGTIIDFCSQIAEDPNYFLLDQEVTILKAKKDFFVAKMNKCTDTSKNERMD